MVTRAVRPFVVPGRDPGERGQHRAAVQDPFAEVRMQPDPLPLLGVERTGPIPDPARDADPSDVVHERRSTQPRGLRAVQSGGSRGGDGERGNPGRVPPQPRGLQVGEVRHRAQRLVEPVSIDRPHGRRLGREHPRRTDRRRSRPAIAHPRPPTRRDGGVVAAPRRRASTSTAAGHPTRRANSSASRAAATTRTATGTSSPANPRDGPCRPNARRRGPALGSRSRPARPVRRAGRRPRNAPTSCADSFPGPRAPERSVPPGGEGADPPRDGGRSSASPRRAGPSGSAPSRR